MRSRILSGSLVLVCVGVVEGTAGAQGTDPSGAPPALTTGTPESTPAVPPGATSAGVESAPPAPAVQATPALPVTATAQQAPRNDAQPVPQPPPVVPPSPPPASPLDGVRLSTLMYLHGAGGSRGGVDYSRFYVGRGYVTASFEPRPWFDARITIDASQQKLSSEEPKPNEGSWAMRLKYAYGKLIAPDLGPVLSGGYLEFGMVHTPWLGFEEDINRYRMQGTMFLERNGLFNSADMGVTVGGNIGPKLGESYTRKVSKAAPGRFGSFAFGVYNGGGYHAHEANQNKTAEGRVTVRPLGPIFPNLQVSWFGIYGKGNSEAAPPWRLHAAMASFEHEYAVVTGTFASGRGNQKGDALDGDSARAFQGYSAFAEARLPWIASSLFGRFDRFDWDRSGGQQPSERVIVGAAYWFLAKNAVVLDWDWLDEKEPNRPDQKELKLTLQVALP